MTTKKHIHWSSAYLPEDLVELLDKEAKARGLKRGQMIQHILRERYGIHPPTPAEIANDGKKKPRKALAVAGE